jgi:hypothetical protein
MADIKHTDDEDLDFTPSEYEGENLPAVRASFAVDKPGESSFVVDAAPPELKIAYGVGGLSQAGFTTGQIVLGEEVVMYSPPNAKGKDESAPCYVTVLKTDQYWKERKAWPWTTPPRTFANQAAAKAAGMITQFPPRGSAESNDRSKWPNCGEAATLSLLVHEPEGVEDRTRFIINVGDKWYAPAVMYIEKQAFTEVGKPISNAALYTHRATGLLSATFALKTRQVQAKTTGNFTTIPYASLVGTKTREEIEALYAMFSK